jgi:endonuclease/exonuclease/phosphatase family metal-dependent hydrolase
MFEENGYIDHIKENNIPTTRNRHSWDRYPNKQYYADYAFTSPEVKVNHFEVIENEASDHLPLVLDIELP